MADVTGPIASLPGSCHAPKGMCDEHPDRPAVKRIQGETDSFGSEMHDLCAECVKELKNVEPNIGTCDWCKVSEVKLRPRRDMDEGMCGRVYYVCNGCVKKNEEALRDELENYDIYSD